jgi:G3E family GTPase
MTEPQRIAVSLVTGFLGSGKTTLIAALLRQPAMHGTAVIVNEFGAVGLDDAVFAQTLEPNDIRLLANGCICCTPGDDLVITLVELTRRADRPRRIVIETTGLADPVPLLQKLMGDPRLRPAIRLDAVVATIDAVNGLGNLDDQQVALHQAAIADRRIVTKADIAELGEVAKLTERLKALNAGADIRIVSHGAIAADELFGAALVDPETGRADLARWLNPEGHRAGPELGHDHHGHNDDNHQHDHEHEHHHAHIHFSGGPAHGADVGTWLIEEDAPVDWEHLSPLLGAIVSHYGDRLLRLKGAIFTADDPRPLVMHGVQKLFHTPVRLDRWPGPARTSIVAIGAPGAERAAALIAEALRASVVPQPAAAE